MATTESHCRFYLLGKTSAKPHLLKPNVAIRGRLTVLFTDVITQMEVHQANYILIVAPANETGQDTELVRALSANLY